MPIGGEGWNFLSPFNFLKKSKELRIFPILRRDYERERNQAKTRGY